MLTERGQKGSSLVAGFPHHPHLGGHQCQIRHGGRQEQLEVGLYSPEVAGLAYSELHQPRQTMLSDLTPFPISGKGLALLK